MPLDKLYPATLSFQELQRHLFIDRMDTWYSAHLPLTLPGALKRPTESVWMTTQWLPTKHLFMAKNQLAQASNIALIQLFMCQRRFKRSLAINPLLCISSFPWRLHISNSFYIYICLQDLLCVNSSHCPNGVMHHYIPGSGYPKMYFCLLKSLGGWN